MNNSSIDSNLELLATVASLYYEEKLDQSSIAKKIGRSRSMVSRLLNKAHEKDLVEIKVKWPLRRDCEVEQKLCDKLGLKQAWVLLSGSSEYSLKRGIGELGAQCFQQFLHEDVKVGIGWGRALYEVVKSMPHLPSVNATIVQIMGALGHGDPMVEGSELARWLAQKVGGNYQFLSAPLIVKKESVAQELLREDTISLTIESGRNVDVSIIGVGALDPVSSGLYRTGYLKDEDIQNLKRSGAVGDLLARQLDKNGRVLDLAINRRVIGQDLQSLKNIENVIAVGTGEEKVEIIRAAIKGGYINILVTDSLTAKSLLDEG